MNHRKKGNKQNPDQLTCDLQMESHWPLLENENSLYETENVFAFLLEASSRTHTWSIRMVGHWSNSNLELGGSILATIRGAERWMPRKKSGSRFWVSRRVTNDRTCQRQLGLELGLVARVPTNHQESDTAKTGANGRQRSLHRTGNLELDLPSRLETAGVTWERRVCS
jgi:hypothetical protein